MAPALATILLLASTILLLASTISAQPPCPAERPCRCSSLRIKCIQNALHEANYIDSVPYLQPSSESAGLRWLYSYHEMRIRDQAMTNLTLRYRWGAIRVKVVEVTNSLVRRIMPDAFAGLVGVQSLNLSYNLVSELHKHSLRHLSTLIEFVLHNNRLMQVHNAAFLHSPFIAKLYLSHNLLGSVPTEIRRLSSLTHLYLQFNNISLIPSYAFAGLNKLIVLDLGSLRDNLRIHDHAFCGIGDNAAFDIPDSSYARTTGLAALYLRNNFIREFSLCSLKHLSSLSCLNLTGTHIPCNCELALLTDTSNWMENFGFHPRFVTFESWLLQMCQPDTCSQTQRLHSRGICSSSSRCNRNPPFDEEMETGEADKNEKANEVSAPANECRPNRHLQFALLLLMLTSCISNY